MYVKLNEDNTVNTFPYSIRRLKKDFPHVSFKKDLTDADLAEWGVYPVVDTQPAYDDMVERLVRDPAPTLNGDTWEIGYTKQPLTPAVIAEKAAMAEENRKRGIVAERDNKISELVEASGGSRTYLLMQSVGLLHTKGNRPLDAGEQAKENALLSAMATIEGYYTKAQAAIDDGVTQAEDIVW